MANPRLDQTGRIGISLVAVGIIASLGIIAYSWLAATFGGLDYKCLVEGPRRESAPYALTSEAVQVHGHVSWWPVGRACDWERADGQGFVTANPGWAITVMALCCVAAALAGAVLLAYRNRAHSLKAHQGDSP